MSRPDDGEWWVIRELRALYGDLPGYDEQVAMRKFREGIRRMETDPGYAAYIERLAEEVGAPDLTGLHEDGTACTHGMAGPQPPGGGPARCAGGQPLAKVILPPEPADEYVITLTSPDVPEISPRIREIFDETLAEYPYDPAAMEEDPPGEHH